MYVLNVEFSRKGNEQGNKLEHTERYRLNNPSFSRILHRSFRTFHINTNINKHTVAEYSCYLVLHFSVFAASAAFNAAIIAPFLCKQYYTEKSRPTGASINKPFLYTLTAALHYTNIISTSDAFPRNPTFSRKTPAAVNDDDPPQTPPVTCCNLSQPVHAETSDPTADEKKKHSHNNP